MEAEIIDYIRRENPSIERLEVEFPGVDRWTLRRLRAEYLRSEGVSIEHLVGTLTQGLPPKGLQAVRAGVFRPLTVSLKDRKKVSPIFTSPGIPTLIISDLHAPVHDKHAFDLVLQVGQAVGVHEIIIAGDAYDVHSLSRYTIAPERPMRWVEEREEAIQPLIELKETFPDIPIRFLPGNHDRRVEKYITSVAPALQGLFTIPELLGIESLGFDYIEEGKLAVADGNLLIKHGTKVSKHAGYSVKAEVEAAGMSVVMGHVHRRALVEVTRASQVLRGEPPFVGVELGCLAQLQPDYIEPEDVANWQHGAAVLTTYDDGFFDIELIRIFNGEVTFRGLRFRSRHL